MGMRLTVVLLPLLFRRLFRRLFWGHILHFTRRNQEATDFVFYQHSQQNHDRYSQSLSSVESYPIYLHPDFLSIVAPKWGYLESKDGLTLFPVAYKGWLGIYKAYTPTFVQQMGPLRGTHFRSIWESDFSTTFEKILNQFFIGYDFQTSAVFNTHHKQQRKNFRIENIQTTKISENHLRHIKKAKQSGLVYQESVSISSWLAFYHEEMSRSRFPLSKKDFYLLEKLVKKLPNQFFVSSVNTKEGEVLCMAIWSQFQQTLTMHHSLSTEKGYEYKAMFYMVSTTIDALKNTCTRVDFDGSDHDGVGRFYAGFGAKEEWYERWVKR